MTGAEHYAEAERMDRCSRSVDAADYEGFTGWSRSELLMGALVHATLAAVEPGTRIDGNVLSEVAG